VEDIYNDPLIKNINQEAAKGFAAGIRKLPQRQWQSLWVRPSGSTYWVKWLMSAMLAANPPPPRIVL
jgi:hypothetical protein